eukprot:TRINITY_DN2938_c1_g2_i1.p1 TRINITY_DN2938_c1_g2~~TRINITY_DN2938_c1_g2_i1.p1  ORF type:complete len:132 (+),score=6.22 TRINITY_DN2938_c1_g2_i1:47-442(+)
MLVVFFFFFFFILLEVLLLLPSERIIISVLLFGLVFKKLTTYSPPWGVFVGFFLVQWLGGDEIFICQLRPLCPLLCFLFFFSFLFEKNNNNGRINIQISNKGRLLMAPFSRSFSSKLWIGVTTGRACDTAA